MRKTYLCFAMLAICAAMAACSKTNEEELKGPGGTAPTCDTVNMKFAANIAPVLSANCNGCHGNGAAGGIKLNAYAGVKLVAADGSLLGAISHASGFSPMPKNGAKLSDCDINKIKAWINQGALNN